MIKLEVVEMINYFVSYLVFFVMNVLMWDFEWVVLEVLGGNVWIGKEVYDVINGFVYVLDKNDLCDGKWVVLFVGNFVEVFFLYNFIGLMGVCFVLFYLMGLVEDYLFVIDDVGVEVLIYDLVKFSL